MAAAAAVQASLAPAGVSLVVIDHRLCARASERAHAARLAFVDFVAPRTTGRRNGTGVALVGWLRRWPTLRMSTKDGYIQIGDLVFLDDKKIVGVPGIGASKNANNVCGLNSDQLYASGEFSSMAVFAVRPQGTWTNLQAFKQLVERQGLTIAEGCVHIETRGAYETGNV